MPANVPAAVEEQQIRVRPRQEEIRQCLGHCCAPTLAAYAAALPRGGAMNALGRPGGVHRRTPGGSTLREHDRKRGLEDHVDHRQRHGAHDDGEQDPPAAEREHRRDEERERAQDEAKRFERQHVGDDQHREQHNGCAA